MLCLHAGTALIRQARVGSVAVSRIPRLLALPLEIRMMISKNPTSIIEIGICQKEFEPLRCAVSRRIRMDLLHKLDT
jgi:hypothetical protein